MASYSIWIKPSAAKEIEAIEPTKLRRLIVERIRELKTDPRPHGCEKLAGGSDRSRARQGAYRIVYAIANDERVVMVFRIGHRSDAHRER